MKNATKWTALGVLVALGTALVVPSAAKADGFQTADLEQQGNAPVAQVQTVDWNVTVSNGWHPYRRVHYYHRYRNVVRVYPAYPVVRRVVVVRHGWRWRQAHPYYHGPYGWH